MVSERERHLRGSDRAGLLVAAGMLARELRACGRSQAGWEAKLWAPVLPSHRGGGLGPDGVPAVDLQRRNLREVGLPPGHKCEAIREAGDASRIFPTPFTGRFHKRRLVSRVVASPLVHAFASSAPLGRPWVGNAPPRRRGPSASTLRLREPVCPSLAAGRRRRPRAREPIADAKQMKRGHSGTQEGERHRRR
jgi:hypothetical protein